VSRFDDRLAKELERAATPAEPTDVFEEIERRRGRRVAVRRIETALLAAVVFAGSIGGVLVLNRAFHGEGATTTPALPPAQNGLIVVSFGDDGGTHLYLQDPDDTSWNHRDHQLTDPAANPDSVYRDTNPALSPDGRTVAFERTEVSISSTTTSVWTIGTDGSDLRRVLSADLHGGQPAWSPDGTRIAYRGLSMDAPGIFVVNADGSGDRALGAGDGPLGNAIDPAWSPDGTKIAVAVPDGSDTSSIASVDVETGERTVISPAFWDAGSPSWSPDGQRLTFAHGGGVVVLTLDGGEVRELTPTHTAEEAASADLAYVDSEPTWSPDGAWIAFQRSSGPSETFVYAVRPDGTDLHRIGLGGDPAWGPAQVQTDASPTDPSEPTEGPVSDTPSATDDRPEHLSGIAYPVCRPLSISGDFGEGSGGRIFVFEAAPEQGCRGREGFQHVGIAPDGETITTVSGRLETCLDSSGCWPFATPDLDGDGIDEIALGIGWVPSMSSVALYRLEPSAGEGGAGLAPMRITCPSGVECAPSARFDWGRSGDARAEASCGALLVQGNGEQGPGLTIRSFEAGVWEEATYRIEAGELVLLSGPASFTGTAGDGPSADAELCDDPVFPLEVIAPDVAARVEQLLEEYA
jgi:Tol biopolymer transport system component